MTLQLQSLLISVRTRWIDSSTSQKLAQEFETHQFWILHYNFLHFTRLEYEARNYTSDGVNV